LYYRWRQRRVLGQLEDLEPTPVDLYQALPEEVEAVRSFALKHSRDGYRRLAWMMVDQDVAYLSPSSVYRILDELELLCRYKPSRAVGSKPEPPTAPHQVWHTDLMYLWIRGRWYFFIGVLDGFSRYIVHWELLASMRAGEVVDAIHAALEKYPGLCPSIIHDNGPQFTSREFRSLIKQFSLADIAIRVYHPESNGKIERFHRSLRQEGLGDQQLADQLQAREIIGCWVAQYNQERLHSGLQYLTPEDVLMGRRQERLEQRRQKLAAARRQRVEVNRRRAEERRRQEESRQQEASCQRAECQGTLTSRDWNSEAIGGSAPEPPGFSALCGNG
jgi:transposase InsO family protein